MQPEWDVIGDFFSPCGGYKVMFDDDGKVAYAYLKKGGAIVGDVWLYNRCPTPDQTEWKDRDNLPFANCKGYMREEGRLQKSVRLDDFRVAWKYAGDEPKAYIYVCGELLASVGVGEKPGCARFATRDGPLAKRMVLDEPAAEPR
jgi:hypothetical protein